MTSSLAEGFLQSDGALGMSMANLLEAFDNNLWAQVLFVQKSGVHA